MANNNNYKEDSNRKKQEITNTTSTTTSTTTTITTTTAVSFEYQGIFSPTHIFSAFPISYHTLITSLNINSNLFTYVPDEISLLCNLEVLNVARNHIRFSIITFFLFYCYTHHHHHIVGYHTGSAN